MAGEWRVCTIDQLKADEDRAIAIGPFGSRMKAETYVAKGVPVIRGNNISDTRTFVGDFVFVSDEDADELRSCNVFAGDLVFPHRGAIGEVGIVPTDGVDRYILSSSLMKLTCNRNLIDPLFLFYFFRSKQGRHALLQNASTVGTPGIGQPLASLRSISVPVPPLLKQRAIAHILGTLDDKIELNRRMNETLEAMARALFKSWFVDFDPVRAKVESRETGLPRDIADLFPDRLVNSELGEIPEGWEIGRLGDILKQRVERCVASEETAARPYVPIDCIISRSLFLLESKPGVEAQSSLTRFYKGDLLFGAMRPYFHKVCIAPFAGTTRTTAFVLTPMDANDFAFATLLLHHPNTIDYATRHSTGTTIPYAVWTCSLENMPIVIPPLQIRESFNAAVLPMLARIPAPYFENRTLAALRDALLPKLVSGELRVQESYGGINHG